MVEEEQNIINVMTTCRLCLNEDAEYNIFTINSPEKEKISYLDMILNLFSFPIKQNDKLPSKICSNCKEQLFSCYKFKVVVENSNKQLQCLITESDKLEELMNSINECKQSNVDNPINNHLNFKSKFENDVKEELINDFHESNEDYLNDPSLCSSDEFDEDDDKPLIFVKPLPVISPAKISTKKSSKQKHRLNKTEYKGKIITRLDENGKIKYLCDFCPKEFTDKSSRRRHRKVQHFGILYYCEICKKNFRSKTSHANSHKVDKNKCYQCLTCNEIFTTYYAFQCHKKSHSHQSEYACDTCGKKFADKHLCTSHKRRVHDKERPHQCTYCSKTFFSSHSLKDHITTHTKVRRYDCKVCGMLFTTSTILKEHEMRHTGNKSFACQLCEKKFYRRKDLVRHELIHSKSYEHQCTYCGLKFRRKDHLSTHEKGVHHIIKNNNVKNEK